MLMLFGNRLNDSSKERSLVHNISFRLVAAQWPWKRWGDEESATCVWLPYSSVTWLMVFLIKPNMGCRM